jgi:hypothetical protein
VAGTPVPPFLSRDGQDNVHENPEQKILNANKIIEIQKICPKKSDLKTNDTKVVEHAK